MQLTFFVYFIYNRHRNMLIRIERTSCEVTTEKLGRCVDLNFILMLMKSNSFIFIFTLTQKGLLVSQVISTHTKFTFEPKTSLS